jgi:hypothetical protein
MDEPPPEYYDDHGDSGGSWSGPPPGERNAPSQRSGPGSSSGTLKADQTDGPALEVLRHAAHNRGEVEAWLRVELFRRPQHRAAVGALQSHASIGEAVAAATDTEPQIADLLARLAVDEPTSEPFDAVKRLATEVARAEMTELRLGAGSRSDPAEALAESAFLGHCIDGLRAPDTSMATLERLLAWLAQRVGDGG